jgi:hypothetical protein
VTGLAQANNAQAQGASQAGDVQKQPPQTSLEEEQDSSITVEVLGFGGGEGGAEAQSSTPP